MATGTSSASSLDIPPGLALYLGRGRYQVFTEWNPGCVIHSWVELSSSVWSLVCWDHHQDCRVLTEEARPPPHAAPLCPPLWPRVGHEAFCLNSHLPLAPLLWGFVCLSWTCRIFTESFSWEGADLCSYCARQGSHPHHFLIFSYLLISRGFRRPFSRFCTDKASFCQCPHFAARVLAQNLSAFCNSNYLTLYVFFVWILLYPESSSKLAVKSYLNL